MLNLNSVIHEHRPLGPGHALLRARGPDLAEHLRELEDDLRDEDAHEEHRGFQNDVEEAVARPPVADACAGFSGASRDITFPRRRRQ